uniref:Endonuclease/exonuclease/phosphatase domain-containing protein n=1 Tax=Octopus bimaculoides TaxID=37653 RepID=A0A0L8GCS1_OCTBM
MQLHHWPALPVSISHDEDEGLGFERNISKEMDNYKFGILGLCETRWIDNGQTKLVSGKTIIYSGHKDDKARHTRGVALMLTKKAVKALIEWQPINERLILAKSRTSHKWIFLTIVMCYAPTNDVEELAKVEFYDTLQSVIEKRTKKELIMVMGDFNAKVGNINLGYEAIMGKHGIGSMNANGQLFANFCANELVIGRTLFPHKDLHKATWILPDLKTQNQIDHICVSCKFRRSLLDVRVKRGANAASDHHLLFGKLQLKLRALKEECKVQQKYNVDLLKHKDTQIQKSIIMQINASKKDAKQHNRTYLVEN